MQSTACHYQCQNTNTCHTDVKQELITHLQGLLLSCIFWVTTLHSEGHTDFLNTHTHTLPLLHTDFLNTHTHTTFTAHRLPQYTHTHYLYCTQTSSIHTHTLPLLHTDFLNTHTHRLYCIQASSIHTLPLLHTDFLNTHTHCLYCTQAYSIHTPPLLHTDFLNTHTAFTAHRLPQYTHTHHLALTSTAHRLQHIHHLALKSTAHRLPQHTHHLALSLLNSTTVCAAWAPDHHQGNPGLKVTFDPRDYYPCHLATVITCIHVLSTYHCYMYERVANLQLLL